MNIISNEKLIKRNARLAQITLLGGMLILFGGIFVQFRDPTQIWIIWGSLVVGFIMAQLGVYFTNRFGRSPRPDEHLNAALKGLDGNYSLYHYKTPTSHLLVGPAGVWVLLPRYQRGTITYEKGRYKQKGGGLLLGYLKIFGQEGIGRPDLEVDSETESITKYLKKLMPEQEPPPVQAALVFTDERAILDAEDAPIPTLPAKRLKEFIRKSSKGKTLPPLKVKEIQQAIEG